MFVKPGHMMLSQYGVNDTSLQIYFFNIYEDFMDYCTLCKELYIYNETKINE